VGDHEVDALLDTGYSGDVYWSNPPACAVVSGPAASVDYWTFDGPTRVSRRQGMGSLRLGGVVFEDFMVESAGSSERDSGHGYDVIVGLGILRRCPFAIDFQNRTVMFRRQR
jgi:hypothetical protein